jgi:branched-chain amino acid transport system ATP-binding protein
MALLEIDDIHVFYDNIEALKGISIAVEEKQIVTLVGANGAGKTTVARAIAGLLRYQGEIRYAGRLLKPDSAERNRRPVSGRGRS